jgi:hypothetical protein
MKAKIEAIAKELQDSVQLKEANPANISKEIPAIISVLKAGFITVKSLVSKYEFESQKEEITFFKYTKPKMFYKLIYYTKVQNIELHRPVCGYDAIKDYLKREQDNVNLFYHTNSEFAQYCRLDNCMFDEHYFLRHRYDGGFNVEIFSFERDANFSTNADLMATELLANDMLAVYLDAELAMLKRNEYQLSYPSSHLVLTDKWTDSKSALVEVIYAIHTANSVNNGQVDIKVLAAKFSTMFNIDLGDIYRTFLDIRGRKGNRTVYLSRLAEFLNQRMDEMDSKY